jgi:hypothetical protein
VEVYVEHGVAMATDSGVAAWSFDLDHWGACGQGATETEAIAALKQLTRVDDVEIAERIEGDEGAFERDAAEATLPEVDATLRILRSARAETLRLVGSASPTQLDFVDESRQLPIWADWNTARQLAWHITDTESRYYLPRLGLPEKRRGTDLVDELRSSGAHVRASLATLGPAEVAVTDGEVWTSVKLLRRLAWHERGEFVPLRKLLARGSDGR